MKRALFKDSIKEIKKTFKRFLSILMMAFLGVGFFAGLRATSPDMIDTLDKYFDDQNVYDIQVLSTLGLTDNDIQELKKVQGVEQVYGSYETDGKIEIDERELIAKVLILSDMSKPILVEGKMPQSATECLVEQDFLPRNKKKIGDKITVEIKDMMNDEGEDIKVLNNKELTIVGTVKSPLYISKSRGNSNLGAGMIDYFIYITPDNVNAKDVYTSIYLTAKNTKPFITSTKEYEDYIEKVKKDIEKIKNEREIARQNDLKTNANKKVEDAEKELNTEKEDALKKLNDGEKELNDGKRQLKNAENQINNNERKLKKQFTDAENKIKQAKEEIEQGKIEFAQKEKEANQKFQELETQKQGLQGQLEQVNQGLISLETEYNNIEVALQNPNLTPEQKAELEATKTEILNQINNLKQQKVAIETGIQQIDAGIASGKEELKNGKEKLIQGETTLKEQEKTLKEGKNKAYRELANARNKLSTSKADIAEAEKKLKDSRKEFDEKIADAEKKLLDAKEKILDIERPKWYILDRNTNIGYASFTQDTKSIANIARVFPIVFFIVATLISLTSMTRMVEEQRTQIGTLKALGYNKFQITSKYILYASSASIIGGALGMCVGFIILPKILWSLYSIMYPITPLIVGFRIRIAIWGLVLISLCIIGATIYTALKELRNTPAVLMRPKAPQKGNRIFLERFSFIWKRLNFSNKVTARNLFRYKKRLYMTLFGILGCTALILIGFGIRDSVTNIMPSQFRNVFCYDFQITLKDSLSQEEKQKIIEEIKTNNKISKIARVNMSAGEAINNQFDEDIQIIVPENEEELKGIINIRDFKKKKPLALKDNNIYISDKLSQLLEVKVGDTIEIKTEDDEPIKVKVSGIVENYMNHYAFMNKKTYETTFNKKCDDNVILTKNEEMSEEEQNKLVSEFMKKKEIASVNNTAQLIKLVQDMMDLLNSVVIVLIVSAGLLAFVVLYNLANVNISERIRELATLKVLGFYDKEVYKYVTKETIILTIIGITLGLVFGYFLNAYILGTCEISALRFTKIIYPISYVFAGGITIFFTVLVNIATYFALKKIDMIESLKSVE